MVLVALPAVQADYLRRLAAAGARVVLVLFGGSPIALGGLEDLADAILYAWYPGQEGGRAVADVLFGKAAPSGKLPITFPRSMDQLPPFADYSMRERTHRYATWEPLFPFGFGLSYTRFAYSDLKLEREAIAPGEELGLRVTVANAGRREADEVVQLYLSDLEASSEAPLQSLVGFRRVRLAPGERREMAFKLVPEMLMLVGDDGEPRLEPGRFRVTVGGCSPGQRGVALGAPEPLSALFEVR